MIIKFKDKLKALIDAHKENGADYTERLKSTLNGFNDEDVRRNYTDAAISDFIQEAKDEVLDEWTKVNTVFNQKAKMIVAEAKEALVNTIMNPGTKGSDYAVKINNALQRIQLEDAETFTDDVAYSILKDFVNDYDQMKLFKRQIVNTFDFDMMDIWGNTTFPKTLGAFEQAEAVLASFKELDEMIENIFIHKKFPSDDGVYVSGTFHNMPIDGYTEIANWDSILKLSEEIENIASEY
jgi:hypothetical protein